MAFKWRKWNRAVHRDFGFLFVGMTIIYSLSGIAINHIKDWNPNYVITAYEFTVDLPEKFTKTKIKELLKEYDISNRYLNHYYPNDEELRIFIKDGNLSIDLVSGEAYLEQTRNRPILKPMNYLHYNPQRIWTWYSDIFCGALILLAITGLFITKGSKGITGRGAWLTIIGILIPIIFLVLFYY